MIDLLFVDDDPDIRMIVKLALALDPELSVRPAASGEAALAMLDGGWLPDGILLDAMMPQMDGPTVLRRIREKPAYAAIPVIFMTAKARGTDLIGYRELGAIGVIQKPFGPVELASQVRKLLGR